MRQNAQQIEIGAWTHDLGSFVEQLNFSGSVGDRAVFFVGRGGGENNIGLLGGFRHEEFVDDEQFRFSTSIAKSPKMRERIRSDNVKRLQLAVLRSFDHLWSG